MSDGILGNENFVNVEFTPNRRNLFVVSGAGVEERVSGDCGFCTVNAHNNLTMVELGDIKPTSIYAKSGLHVLQIFFVLKKPPWFRKPVVVVVAQVLIQEM